MTSINQDNDKDEGEALKRKGIKRRNLLETLESKAEKSFKLKTEEMERRKRELEEREFEMHVKVSLLPGFEPGSPTCKTGMLTTTPQQLTLHNNADGEI